MIITREWTHKMDQNRYAEAGQFIRSARESRKLSLEQAAREMEKLGVPTSKTVLHRLEKIDSLRSDTSRSKHDNIDDIAKVNKAFATLKRHIEAKDFDVLLIHSFDRLARNASLIVQVIQRTILAGAYIYAHQGGTVDSTNYLILCGSIAFMVAAPIRSFVEKTQATKEKQLQSGLHVQGRTLVIHRIVRDKNGKRTGMEINEDVRTLFSRLIELLCDNPERISWKDATAILNREGHRSATGKLLRAETLHRTVVHPEFWGHTARRYARDLHANKGLRYSYEWVFDPSIAPPDGIIVYYDTHPPFLGEPQASKLKARLRQDFTLKGKAMHGKLISPFSGLVVCYHCGTSMGWRRDGDRIFATCEGRWYRPPVCDQKNIIVETVVREALDQRLREIITNGDLHTISSAEAAESSQRTIELQTTIMATQRELTGLLRDKANTTDPDILAEYTDLIADTSERLKSAKIQLQRAQAEMMSEDVDDARHRALQELIQLTVDGLWKMSPQHQNRLLHQLFGYYRLAADQRTIVGIARGKRIKHVP